ncbi:MAG: FAD-binding protein [Bacteroidetes bacterium]|nr:MAG: FAD-binding protein [Bacteroidota bacterium]
MNTRINLSLPPQVAFDPEKLNGYLVRKFQTPANEVVHYIVRKRSIDARKAPVQVHLQLDIYADEPVVPSFNYKDRLQIVAQKKPVLIVGAGPAGLFAALRLIEIGLKPVIIERGKDVRSRRRDLAAINKQHLVNPDSNYCFGEGGAGTFSDGKLYTRSKKRGDIKKVLEILVSHGAPKDILIDAHPHIGTNKLPKVVKDIRESILKSGGEVHFNAAIDNLIVMDGKITGVTDRSGHKYQGEAVILATGHSARDIYVMLHSAGVSIEAKPFALGVRVEHPQSLIDSIQYHGAERGLLPAASYSLSHQIGRDRTRGVFSFCMCPGGFIVPAATTQGEIVVNGMSPSTRDSKFANSGIVVSVSQSDFTKFGEYGPLAGMYFQQSIEKNACVIAGNSQAAPAQRLMDFLNGRRSSDLPETSYQPGVNAQILKEVLPSQIEEGIKYGFRVFGKRMKGYLTNEAVLLGVESRTSSPVKIPRDPKSLQHPQVEGLIPCGEGAGYAGGIMSAAMDGIRCAEAVARLYKIPLNSQ